MENTLILDSGYRPLGVVHWTRAVTLLFQNKIEVLVEYDGFIRSTSLVIKVPAVVRLLKMFKRFRKPAKFSRISVYARDGYRCQYCNTKHLMNDLTYDHVVPRSQGGKTEWGNIVTCCYDCNMKKRDRTPEKAGMILKKKPVQPTDIPVVTLELSRESVPDAWRDWMYWNSPLDES